MVTSDRIHETRGRSPRTRLRFHLRQLLALRRLGVLPADAARTFHDVSRQWLHGSWEEVSPDELYVLNHLDRDALSATPQCSCRHSPEDFAARLRRCFAIRSSSKREGCGLRSSGTFSPSDSGIASRARRIKSTSTPIFDMTTARSSPRPSCDEFYDEFAAICRQHGAFSRVQCHGAPTDLLAAYAAVDIPESEAILFSPPFSRIAASAAAFPASPRLAPKRSHAFTVSSPEPTWRPTILAQGASGRPEAAR